MKKKAIVVLMCAAISLAAAGCGQKAAPESGEAVTTAQAAGDAAQAVSYTHLDVYKRQVS